jgi:hypothetical protein
MLRLATLTLVLSASAALAGPNIQPGDLALRHDIQRLAAHGVITGTTSTWPLAWGPILDDINQADASKLAPGLVDALARVKARAAWEARTDEVTYNAKVGLADNATRVRSFQNTPRGRGEASVGLSWIGNWLSADLNVQYVDSAQDDEEARYDNSMIGAVVGNWSIAASTQERWWGPGWDGSIILSNNARPIPSLTIDRVFTDSFDSKWLSWLGPWDMSVMFGQLEKERHVPDAQFFGMRFNIRPFPTLEIGISRTAQWCGDGRPCDADTFVDLFLGRDNVGDDDIGEFNEPGNQLAGFDLRWTPGFLNHSVGIYAQAIGEDEAGGFPSRYMGQLGIDWSGYLFDRWSSQAFLEYSGTACQFHESSKRYNCGYNHGIYETGYRYRGRPIGHGADNDAELISAGFMLVDAEDTQWRALLRVGELNAGGAPDSRNTLTPTPQDIASIDLAHSRAFRFGVLDVGLGYESIDDAVSGSSSSEGRVYVQWRSSY